MCQDSLVVLFGELVGSGGDDIEVIREGFSMLIDDDLLGGIDNRKASVKPRPRLSVGVSVR
jgi:hypothetical protein